MISFHRHGIESQQSQLAQGQHDLGHAASQKDLDRGVTDRAIRQHVHQTRRLAIERVSVPVRLNARTQPGTVPTAAGSHNS